MDGDVQQLSAEERAGATCMAGAAAAAPVARRSRKPAQHQTTAAAAALRVPSLRRAAYEEIAEAAGLQDGASAGVEELELFLHEYPRVSALQLAAPGGGGVCVERGLPRARRPSHRASGLAIEGPLRVPRPAAADAGAADVPKPQDPAAHRPGGSLATRVWLFLGLAAASLYCAANQAAGRLRSAAAAGKAPLPSPLAPGSGAAPLPPRHPAGHHRR
jgi:hypothetical protein